MDQLDLVVFDMAGTTIRAADQVPVAFQQAFEQFGVKPSEEEIRSVRGWSKREAIADILTRRLGSADGQRLTSEVYGRFQRILMKRYESQGLSRLTVPTRHSNG
jgi:beta-phosphoglucomutase-like phosphatase (HAD superfamily)